MPVTYRADSTNTGVSSSATGAVSAEVQVGDIQIASIIATSSGTTITAAPSGWTLIRGNTPTGFRTFQYWKVRASGDTSSPAWTLSGNDGWGVDIWAGSGQHSTSPINVQNGAVNTSSNSLAVSVTPTVADCMLLMYGAVETGTGGQGRTWTQTAGMTERIDATFDTYYRCLADQALTGGSGTAQSRTATVTGSTANLSVHLVAIAPAPAATATGSFMPFFGF